MTFLSGPLHGYGPCVACNVLMPLVALHEETSTCRDLPACYTRAWIETGRWRPLGDMPQDGARLIICAWCKLALAPDEADINYRFSLPRFECADEVACDARLESKIWQVFFEN